MGRKTDIAKTDPKKLFDGLTSEQQELISLTRTGRKDPVFFAYELLGVELHDGQKLWLWMTTRTQLEQAFELGMKLHDENRKLWASREEFDTLMAKNNEFLKNILVPSNRWGKTLCTSVKHLWYNYYKIGVRGTPEHVAQARCGTLNLSPHSNQCQAGYDYILDILFSKFTYTVNEPNEKFVVGGSEPESLPVSKKNQCKIENFYLSDNSQKRIVMFKNGTSYKAVPTGEDQASSLAGTRYLYISYDEAAQSLHLKAELPAKIMSRLIDFGGPMDLVSTPEVDKPSHQYFFHISKLGLKFDDGWFTLIGRLTDNIFLGKKEVDQIAGSIKSTDPVKYRQVVFGEFVTTGSKMFDQILIERLWDGFTPGTPLYEHKYLLWADWGFSDTGDPTVFYVIDYTPRQGPDNKMITNEYKVVYREEIRGGDPFAVMARTKILQREWNGAKFGHDASSMGGVMIKKMLRAMGIDDVIDFSASGDKADMLFCLIVVLSENRRKTITEDGRIIEGNPNFGRLRSYYIGPLEEQMGNYQYNPDKGVSDKKLVQDDVMCLGMAIWWLERKHNKSDVKMISFNPLAPTLGGIFDKKEAQKLEMRSITIPEKRIM